MDVVVRRRVVAQGGGLALLLASFLLPGSARAYTIGAAEGTNTATQLELRLTLWDDGNPLQAVFHETGCEPDEDCPFSLTLGVAPVFVFGPGGSFGTFDFSATLRHEGTAESVQFSGYGHELGTHPLDVTGPFWQQASFHLAEGPGESYLTVSATLPEPRSLALLGLAGIVFVLLRHAFLPRRRRGFRGALQPARPGATVAACFLAAAVGLPGTARAFTVDVVSLTNEPGLFAAVVRVLHDGNADPLEARISGCVPDVPSDSCPFTLNLQVWPVPILPGVFDFQVIGNLAHVDSAFAPAFELHNHDPQIGTEIVLGQDEVWQTWSLGWDGATRFELVATAAVPEPRLAVLTAALAATFGLRRRRREPRPV